jgi:Kef-type K+ transport system membrane component KefB
MTHDSGAPLVHLLEQTLLVVGVSRAFAFAARGLRQPMVVAEIVAGIALGPSLLGRFSPEVQAAVFPQQSIGPLVLVSQFGLVLFMFTLGLDFDSRLLQGRGRAAVAISHTGIVLPFLLGGALAYAMREHLAIPGVPVLSFVLFFGVAMSITAFPVLARLLAERRLTHDGVGAVVLACAAVDDVTAWCVLALVVGIVRVSGFASAAATFALTVGYCAAMVLGVRPLLRRLALCTERNGGPGRNHVVALLLFALVSALATEFIGIHALFGAFLAGALVPTTGGFARSVAERIEPVVVLLLPLFFAYSGLRTEIGLLRSPADWLMCGLVVCIACVGKVGGGALAARFSGMPMKEAAAVGILMNTRGLMELVVLNIGLGLGVVSPKVFTMMVLMALITTFMTTPLLDRVYPSRADLPEPDAAARSRSRIARQAA